MKKVCNVLKYIGYHYMKRKRRVEGGTMNRILKNVAIYLLIVMVAFSIFSTDK